MKYIVLSSGSTQSLQDRVNKAITEGYVPQGGVSLSVDQGRYEYVQAMVKNV